jgi:predicted nucleotidyltransferase
MLSDSLSELKSQAKAACLEEFPEAKALVIWGSATTEAFHPKSSDIDIIIEIEADVRQESALSERLKKLVKANSFGRIDPLLYCIEDPQAKHPLEFIAPFGFYKANAFIPYMIQAQSEVIFGESRLLARLAKATLANALASHLPQVMLSLRRLRVEAELETEASEVLRKHNHGAHAAIRTLYAFDHGKIGSKPEALAHLTCRFPDYQAIADLLTRGLEGTWQEGGVVKGIDIRAMAEDLAAALQSARLSEDGVSARLNRDI